MSQLSPGCSGWKKNRIGPARPDGWARVKFFSIEPTQFNLNWWLKISDWARSIRCLNIAGDWGGTIRILDPHIHWQIEPARSEIWSGKTNSGGAGVIRIWRKILCENGEEKVGTGWAQSEFVVGKFEWQRITTTWLTMIKWLGRLGLGQNKICGCDANQTKLQKICLGRDRVIPGLTQTVTKNLRNQVALKLEK